MTPEEKINQLEELFLAYDGGDEIETDAMFIDMIRATLDGKKITSV